jgi:uncharacterized protein (TIGR02588 family)
MSQAEARPRERSGQKSETGKHERSAGRKLAEWVTMGVSALLILALAGYLVVEGMKPQPPYVRAEARPLIEQVRQQGERYILPVEVANHGERTLRDITMELRYVSPGGKEETREFTIDYLGEKSSQSLYFYFDEHPGGLQVEARPVSYRFD